MCSHIEQTVCLYGQTSVEVDHHRRVNTTVKITGYCKKAKAILDEIADVLEKSGNKLFGENFFMILKRRKEAKEIADAIQPDE